jgi:hypothetical protein
MRIEGIGERSDLLFSRDGRLFRLGLREGRYDVARAREITDFRHNTFAALEPSTEALRR